MVQCAVNRPLESKVLDEISNSGILKVGTTGDYAPFSEWIDGEFQGIDIAMAKSFAASMDVKVIFVKTTWASLSEDLNQNKFHIAMSGITVNSERKKEGFFSKSYLNFGKMPIAQCRQTKMFDHLQKIDQPSTRVIVNPGGTNESFAKENIKKAKINLHPNNNTIFQQILEGRADVMITDSVEVYYQSQKHKGRLCPTMNHPLTEEQMAIYLPKDPYLKIVVNSWLKTYLKSKNQTTLFNKWLGLWSESN